MMIIIKVIIIIITIAIKIIIMIMVYSMEPTRWLVTYQNYLDSYSYMK